MEIQLTDHICTDTYLWPTIMPDNQTALQYNPASNDDNLDVYDAWDNSLGDNELEELARVEALAIPLDNSGVGEARKEEALPPLDTPSPSTSVALCQEAYSPRGALEEDNEPGEDDTDQATKLEY